VVPVLAAPRRSTGAFQPPLDAIVSYLPSADKITAPADANGTETTLRADPAGPFGGGGFKTLADTSVGLLFPRLLHFQVQLAGLQRRQGQTGTRRTTSAVWAREHINTDVVVAGDIGAVGKLAATLTGDTISEEQQSADFCLASTSSGERSYSVAVNPRTVPNTLTRGDRRIHRIAEEDPTLQYRSRCGDRRNDSSGLGEPHVKSPSGMTRRFGVNTVDVGLPRAAYRETISGKTTAEYKHKKQTGGFGQYGHVFPELEPLTETEFEFSERARCPVLTKPSRRQKARVRRWTLTFWPAARSSPSATLTDGSYQYVIRARWRSKSSKEAFKRRLAKLVLLEPILNLKVTVPDSHTGDVMSEISTLSGLMSAAWPRRRQAMIDAQVPSMEVQLPRPICARSRRDVSVHDRIHIITNPSAEPGRTDQSSCREGPRSRARLTVWIFEAVLEASAVPAPVSICVRMMAWIAIRNPAARHPPFRTLQRRERPDRVRWRSWQSRHRLR